MTATVTATATEAGTETGTITGGLWWSTMRETQWSLSKTKSIFGGYCGFLSLFSVINCCGFVIPPQGYRSFSTTYCGCIFITAGSKRRGEGEHCVVNSIAPVPIAFDRLRDRETVPKTGARDQTSMISTYQCTLLEYPKQTLQSSINKGLTQFKLTCI